MTSRRAAAGSALLAGVVLLALLAPWVTADPLAIDLDRRLLPPGPGRWMGTDELGRDVMSRISHGARPSILVASFATMVSLLVGIPVGALAGYARRGIDLALARLIDASLAVPSLVLLLLIAALRPAQGATGSSVPAWVMVGAAVGVVRWGIIARYMRAEVMRHAAGGLAEAARAAGAGPGRVLARHLVPVGLPPVAVAAAFGAGSAVMAEASLSFLGLGVQPPTPTWGQMIASAATRPGDWWMLLFPGALVALTVASFHLVGSGLARPAD
ncbi:MAG: ABC transporter permease [Candidatus Polarisedimenticolia bacterium]